MAEQRDREPDALRQLSTRLGERGSRANPVLSAAQAQIAANGRAGGGGVLGSRFAHGPQSFVRQLATVAGRVGAQPALLNSYAQPAAIHVRAFPRDPARSSASIPHYRVAADREFLSWSLCLFEAWCG
jgi:hypothetical protein